MNILHIENVKKLWITIFIYLDVWNINVSWLANHRHGRTSAQLTSSHQSLDCCCDLDLRWRLFLLPLNLSVSFLLRYCLILYTLFCWWISLPALLLILKESCILHSIGIESTLLSGWTNYVEMRDSESCKLLSLLPLAGSIQGENVRALLESWSHSRRW